MCCVLLNWDASVQLFPDVIQVMILLFADDIALISDTIVGLQQQLNLLKEYYAESKRVVNIRIYISYYSLLSNPNVHYNMLVTYIY